MVTKEKLIKNRVRNKSKK